MNEIQWALVRRFMLLVVRAMIHPKVSEHWSRELWDGFRQLEKDLAGTGESGNRGN